jgi:hypothetical protein
LASRIILSAAGAPRRRFDIDAITNPDALGTRDAERNNSMICSSGLT